MNDVYNYCEDALSRAHGEVVGQGAIRRSPADFRVEEILGFDPDGEGDHWLLWVEKSNANTHWIAQQLSQAAGVHPRDVGHAGLKDRRAVTRQWFSVPARPDDEPQSWPLEDARILTAARHRRKLRIGTLKGNRFSLVIRDVQASPEELDKRLARIASLGVPNYFGPQRFGREGDNVARLLKGRLPRRGNLRGILLSAGRSWLFNQLLGERVTSGQWDRVLAGDMMMLDGSRSHFSVEAPDAELQERCREADIHPSGPLWGRGPSPAGGDVAVMENRLADAHPALLERLDQGRLDHDRRSLRLRVKDLIWTHKDDSLHLSFSLPAGAFATSMLRELINYREEGEQDHD